MSARIYQPAKTAMQSGRAKGGYWILEFIPNRSKNREPLMGWVSSQETKTQISLKFPTLESAQHYADSHFLKYTVLAPHGQKLCLHPYSEKFLRKPS